MFVWCFGDFFGVMGWFWQYQVGYCFVLGCEVLFDEVGILIKLVGYIVVDGVGDYQVIVVLFCLVYVGDDLLQGGVVMFFVLVVVVDYQMVELVVVVVGVGVVEGEVDYVFVVVDVDCVEFWQEVVLGQ